MSEQQEGFRSFEIDLKPGTEESIIRFHDKERGTLDALFGETGQIRQFSRLLTPDNKMIEYFLFDGALETIQSTMRASEHVAGEVAMVDECWRFPQRFLRRIYHYEAR